MAWVRRAWQASAWIGGTVERVVRVETKTVDVTRWPALEKPSDVRGPAIAEVANSLRNAARRIGLRLDFPDDTAAGEFDAPARMVLLDPPALWSRLSAAGVRGLAESYMAGEWTSPDLTSAIATVAPWVAESSACTPSTHRMVRSRRSRAARRRADEEVDLEDGLPGDLCALYTDVTMSTSGAVFASGARTRRHLADGTELIVLDPPGSRPFRTDLADAQRRSAEMLLDLAGVEDSSHVLLAPPGWGELPMRAAERGAHTRSVTTSTERLAMLGKRFSAAGLDDRIALAFQPLSEVTGDFEALIADEPAGARGLTGLRHVLEAADRLVRPGGRVVVQTSVASGRAVPALRELADWQCEYISNKAPVEDWSRLSELIADVRRLRVLGRVDITAHHAETARLWREKFSVRGRDAAALGFDAVYRRMWTFYLAATEARLRSGWVDSVQLVLHAGDYR